MKEAEQTQVSVLEYEITNADKLCGEGNINSIRQVKGYWKSYIGTDKTKLRCQFKTICRPVSVEIKISNANMIEFTSFFDRQEITNELRCISSKQREANVPIIYKFKNLISQTDEMYVDLHSFNKKQVQISWLKFEGQVLRAKPEKKRESIKKANAEVFKERVKESAQRSPKRDKVQKMEAEEAKINLPKQNTKAHLSIVVPLQFQSQQLLSPDDIQIQQCYKTQYVSRRQMQRVADVSQKWLQSQRKMEASFGVKVEHKLSSKINPKCLRGMKFCFPNVYGEEKSRYVKLVRQMGAFVREEPCQGCIVATTNPRGSPIFNLARIMAETHVVRLNYVEECYRLKTKLKLKRFQFSPQQFFT